MTGHSPRAGFVSDAVLEGRDVPTVMRESRHRSEPAFSIYIDELSALAVALSRNSAHLLAWGEYARSHFSEFWTRL